MHTHVFETFIPSSHAERDTELLCKSLLDCTLSIVTDHTERVLNFGDGQAFIRQAACGLHLRVQAQDLAMFIGIRSLLQVALSRTSTDQCGILEWHPAADDLPGALRKAGRR